MILFSAPPADNNAQWMVHMVQDEYEVEAFLEERGHGSRREFLVKWTGYDDEENQWVDAKQLKADMPAFFKTLSKGLNNKRARVV